MPRIKNNTGRVVTVYGEHFCKQISIDEELVLADDDLCGVNTVKVRYYSSSELKSGWSFVEGKSFTGKYKPEFYSKSNIPLITVFQCDGDSEIVLEKKDVSLPLLILLFKRIVLSSISPVARNKAVSNKTLFQNSKDKKRLLRYLYFETIIITVLAFLFLVSTIPILSGNDEIGMKITATLVTIFFLHLSFTDVFHLITSKKRELEASDNSK